MALDYDWDHNNTGFSKSHCLNSDATRKAEAAASLQNREWIFDLWFSGMVYFTVASKDSVAGAIKRAFIPSVDDGSNNIGASVELDIKYITTPDGIAVDWVGR